MNVRKIVNEINSAYKINKNKPIVLNIGGTFFSEVTGAKVYSSSSYKINAPYTDFVIDKRNTKGINIAIKPVVFSESIKRLEVIVPGMRYKFIQAAIRKIKELKIEDGEPVPEIYGKIDRRHTDMLFKGTQSLGGPVHFIYLNEPKETRVSYDDETSTLFLPGNIESIKSYSQNINIFLKLEPLYEDQKYDSKQQLGGIPVVYGKSETRDLGGNRITIVKEAPATGIIVDIE